MGARMDVLLGAQWGDEGKGKVVDVMAPDYDVIARFQGGPNAGHTLIFEGKKHVLHTIPSGVFREGTVNLVGNGVVIDPVIFLKEMNALKAAGVDVRDSLLISRRAHLILPTHRALDAASEAEKGTSQDRQHAEGHRSHLHGQDRTQRPSRGRPRAARSHGTLPQLDAKSTSDCLPCTTRPELRRKQQRNGWPPAEVLRAMQLVDSEHYLDHAMRDGKRVLAEGAQGTLLDIDFGTYPFVTSSNTISAGACTGLGVAPNRIGKVVGIFKAYCTRVGSGPFPTELHDADGEHIRASGPRIRKHHGSPTPLRLAGPARPALRGDDQRHHRIGHDEGRCAERHGQAAGLHRVHRERGVHRPHALRHHRATSNPS